MCGRATLSTPGDELREVFGLDAVPDLPPRFNIVPTQPIAVIREPRRLELLRWGLILPGAHRHGAQGINVRVESVARAPAYRESFRKRRCLVIVDGFFEWQKRDKAKQPFFVRRDDGRPFALAGIWDCSTTPEGEVIDSCAVITGDSKGAMAELHNRMPLIVPATGYARWLDPTYAKSSPLAFDTFMRRARTDAAMFFGLLAVTPAPRGRAASRSSRARLQPPR